MRERRGGLFGGTGMGMGLKPPSQAWRCQQRFQHLYSCLIQTSGLRIQASDDSSKLLANVLQSHVHIDVFYQWMGHFLFISPFWRGSCRLLHGGHYELNSKATLVQQAVVKYLISTFEPCPHAAICFYFFPQGSLRPLLSCATTCSVQTDRCCWCSSGASMDGVSILRIIY